MVVDNFSRPVLTEMWRINYELGKGVEKVYVCHTPECDTTSKVRLVFIKDPKNHHLTVDGYGYVGVSLFEEESLAISNLITKYRCNLRFWEERLNSLFEEKAT